VLILGEHLGQKKNSPEKPVHTGKGPLSEKKEKRVEGKGLCGKKTEFSGRKKQRESGWEEDGNIRKKRTNNGDIKGKAIPNSPSNSLFEKWPLRKGGRGEKPSFPNRKLRQE